MKPWIMRLLGMALLGAVSAQAAAAAAVTVHGSTLGLGAGITVGLTEQFNLRGQFNSFSYDFDDDASDIEYAFDLELGSLGALLDWHPGGGSFRLSAGFYLNDNEVNGTGQPTTATVEIGDAIFNTADVGTLTADLGFDDVVPYLGIGWGNAIGREGRLGIALDIGVLFQGEPDVTFNAVGADSAIQDLLDAEIAQEEANIQDDIDEFDLYPVITLGLNYRL